MTNRERIGVALYANIHYWLKHNYGVANKCETEGCPGKGRFEWALIKGKEYEHKRENFIMLCTVCHRNYDETKEKAEKLRRANKGIKRPPELYKQQALKRQKPIYQLDKDYNIIAKFDSVKEAAQAVNTMAYNISIAANSPNATSNGYRWKFVSEFKSNS